MIKLSTDDALLHELILKYGIQHVYAHIKHKHTSLFDRIMKYNKHENIKFAEMLYRYVHDMKKSPPCIQCGDAVNKFYGFFKGYAIFCSRKCVARFEITKDRRGITLKKKYGVDSLVELRWRK